MNNIYTELYFKERLNLLIISLEALDTYAFNKIFINKNNYNTNDRRIISLIKYNNYMKNIKQNNPISINKKIKIIHHFYNIIIESYLKKIICNILYNYSNEIKSNITIKYINKFKYIYYKTQNYYNTHSYYNNLNIEEIAMTNLYIIYRIQNKTNIYILMKYLTSNNIN